MCLLTLIQLGPVFSKYTNSEIKKYFQEEKSAKQNGEQICREYN